MAVLSAMPPARTPISRKKSPIHLYTAMIISFIIASALNVYPLGDSSALLRPMMMIMVLIFWLIFQPSLVGVGIAFFVGLIADLLLDNKVGQQALCAILMAFFVKVVSGYVKQLSTALVWVLASVCLCIYQVALVLLNTVTTGVFVPQMFISLGMSILVWPLLLVVLRRYTH